MLRSLLLMTWQSMCTISVTCLMLLVIVSCQVVASSESIDGLHFTNSHTLSGGASSSGGGPPVVVQVEGRLVPPMGASIDWFVGTRLHLDGGRSHVGFVRPDGSFTLSSVSSGSYLLEVINSVYIFQPVRVDINSKGKIRARRFNALQPNAVKVLPYPLQMASIGKANYFQQREQLRTLDLLMNPTLLLMVVPFVLIMILPKLFDTDDPELQREMQSLNALNPRQNLPDMSEMLSSMSLFGGSKNTTEAGGTRQRNVRQRLGIGANNAADSFSAGNAEVSSTSGCYGSTVAQTSSPPVSGNIGVNKRNGKKQRS